jgi:hypothetical protein
MEAKLRELGLIKPVQSHKELSLRHSLTTQEEIEASMNQAAASMTFAMKSKHDEEEDEKDQAKIREMTNA